MPYTYPARVDTSKMTSEQVHKLLQTPNLVANRFAKVVTDRFIADYLLTGRYSATGTGSVMYQETGDPVILANDEPAVVAPGAEYPLTTVTGGGEWVSVATLKRGHDSEVYDEEIAHERIDPVNRTMTGLGNSLVRLVDRVALSVVKSKVTRTYDVAADGGDLNTFDGIVTAVLMAKARMVEQGLDDYNYDVVLLTAVQYAKIQAALIKSGALPREADNPILSGAPINAFGLDFVTSEHSPFAEPTLIDRNRLGGMADEDLKSPGYVRASSTGGDTSGAPAMNIESKVQRLVGSDDRDGYRLRVRRVTVPVVKDANAAVRLVNTKI